MLFLKRLFQTPRFQAEGRALYRQIAARARRPILYTLYGVPDTIDGRFEMLCLHAYAVFHGLKGKGTDAQDLSQAIYDAMFADLDGSLRELGAADLGVGRRIKTMTEALNGRIQAYDCGFAADDADLEQAIRRNVYGTVRPADDQVRGMTAYLRNLRLVLLQASFEDLRTSRIMSLLPEPPASLEATNATG
ncbi:ubiquinol-cytochrome C chaperone family protein [Dongia deserti]|uniref:ubiquinol-cytochrome C chaperone family protein n=1 Tax=Dongia deserti TaxID=2268030 RepID=UPI0013C44A2F|nr:ubiquinol-cytochrome C chaperone family protein [Dongia deserti]